MQIYTELPDAIEFYLMSLGFFEVDKRSSGDHADIHIAEPEEEFVAWKPSFEGEAPPW